VVDMEKQATALLDELSALHEAPAVPAAQAQAPAPAPTKPVAPRPAARATTR